MANKLRITTFNCNGVKSKLPVISNMCSNSDIVLLQETWLREDELNILSNVHCNFESFSHTSMNIHDNILIGRPFGGISIMWNKSLSHCCKVVQYEDN